MATSLVNPTAISGELAGMGQMKSNALKAGGAAPGDSRGTQYVGFNGNTGMFTWGRAGTEIGPEQKFIVPAQSLKHGWLFWEGKKPERDTQVMVSAMEQFPAKPDKRQLQGTLPRPHDRDGWSQTYEMTLFGYEDELDKVQLEFAHGSVSYQHFWGDLGVAAATEYEGGSKFIHPVVTVAVGHYEHKDFDRTVYTLDHTLHGFSDGETIQWLADTDAPGVDDDVLG